MTNVVYLSLAFKVSISSDRMLTADSLSLILHSKFLLVESNITMASFFSAFSVSNSPNRFSIIIIRPSKVRGLANTGKVEEKTRGK